MLLKYFINAKYANSLMFCGYCSTFLQYILPAGCERPPVVVALLQAQQTTDAPPHKKILWSCDTRFAYTWAAIKSP